ncbi:DUF2141 domain-containing protein [Ruegeria sp. 2012CJ41-6]|uniref:DUF2141 domain-containing protein n=1 Tax=Ruegeria spongiae TaxID=2942209 RepID=A0ABT0Q0Y7_9RHOB|nr:DUF2141 domain-containing protein [Ruegeria spongiae]MCL6283553.1 DUF2141 domain-containing protein [Ruegeria spongiae]
MRSFKLHSLTALAAAAGCAAFAQAVETAPLSVTVDGIRNGDGAVIVAAFDQAAAFEAMDVSKAVALAQIPAAGTKVSVTFHDLPHGTYAFAALHDEDLDGDLGMNGEVPTEGYAFAAMGRRGLPSKFEDAAVANGETAGSTLRLKYWN